jgi:hypothetical protein
MYCGDDVMIEKVSPLSSLFNTAPPKTAVPTKSPLQLVSWEGQFGHGQYNDYNYTVTLRLKSTSTKDIKLIDASVQFADLLAAPILSIQVYPDRHIAAGDTDTFTVPYNIFTPEEMRLGQMNKDDIKATLVVSRLVFSDNSIGEYKP